MSYLLAVLAAVANAASNVLQRKANREEPPELSMSLRLMTDLVRRPVWLAGLVTVIASFLLMAAALSMGRLASVQPVVVFELPLTLVAAAKVFGSRLSAREWASVLAMSLGLAVLIAFLSPARGNNGRAPGIDWAVAASATIAVLVLLVVVARRAPAAARTALLGVATGLTFGLTAAFMKGMTTGFAHGVGGVFTSWQSYAMVLSGLTGMFLMQNALHSGRLIVAQPGITLADPALAILWGVFVFREHTASGGRLAVAVCGGAVMAASALVLARSPLLEGEGSVREEGAGSPGSPRSTRSAA